MAINTLSALSSLIKYRYEKGFENCVFQNNALLKRLKKEYNVGGYQSWIPYQITLGEGGGSANVGNAVTNSSSVTTKNVLLTRARDFGVASVDGLALNASSTGKQEAFIDAVTLMMESKLQAMANNLEIALFRSGAGALGQIGSGYTNTDTSITLTDPNDAKNFEVGMVIVASTTNDGFNVKASSSVDNTAIITAIDRYNGVLTMDVDGDFAGTDWAAADYLYRQGDAIQAASSSDGTLKVKGLSAWLPSSVASSGDSFFGMDRYTDVERLAGLKFNGASMSMLRAFTGAGVLAADRGEMPRLFVTSFQNISQLCDELQGQAFQTDFSTGEVGFSTIKFHIPGIGPCEVLGSRACPTSVSYLLDESKWVLKCSSPKLINIDERDGLTMRLNATADQLDMRFYFYGQLACLRPGANVRIAHT